MKYKIWKALLRQTRRPGSPKVNGNTSFRPQLETLEEMVLPSGVAMFPTHLTPTHNVSPAAGSAASPSGITPAQIRQAYGINQITFNNGAVKGDGTGETIAIVDAYDDPSIATDLQVFDQQFGLAAPPSFTKVGINASGTASTTTFPKADSGWSGEIELDVEWAHAVAPGAKILLVEANTNNDTDLLNAINYARQQPGVVAVSMSWGGSETSTEASLDSYFTTPAGHAGVTFFGSSGDSGSPGIWPALSTHVVGVGGTTLNINSAGAYLSESGWNGSGGSLSSYLSQPTYQSGLTIHNGNSILSASGKRAGPDVSYDADPNTGFAVYGSYGWGGWAQVGGTSDAAPQWAGLMAIADQGRALAGLGSLDGYTQTLPALYKLPSTDFHDVTSGSNGGYSAGPGFDLVTGRGTPIANLVVRDLVGGSSTSPSKPPTIATPAKVVSQTATSVNLSVLGADAAGEATLSYTWAATGSNAGNVSFSVNGTNASKNTTAMLSQAGTYSFQVTVTDPSGLTVTSQVTVTLNQNLTSVSVTPGTATVSPNSTQQFTATALDQFGNPLASQPAITWSLSTTGQGALTTTGMYTAPSTAGGSVQVRATVGGLTGTATVSVQATSTVLFQDNLANGAGNWSVTSGYGDYYLVNDNGGNRILVQNDGYDVSRVVAGQSTWTNYSYQATLNIDSSTYGSVSLLARVQDNSHLYFFGWNDAMSEWMIAKKNGTTVTILATSSPYSITYNQDYTVRADLNGSSLKLYVGGVLEVSATDSTFTHGKIGFTATDGVGELGNVLVTSISANQARTQAQTSGSVITSPAAVGGSYTGWQAALWQIYYGGGSSFFGSSNSSGWLGNPYRTFWG